MAKNIIMYGPPGTGKTYLLQSLMNDYIDYDIDDTTIKIGRASCRERV